MKYIKEVIILIIIILIISGFLLVLSYENSDRKVCFDSNCFVVEVVDDPASREKGLMDREKMDLDRGMLFIFEYDGKYPFWMKNTLIKLDMIWIDINGKIVDIKHNALPCEKDPCEIIYHEGNARYVLEVNGGLADKYGFEIGDKVDFVNIFGNE